MSLALDAVAVVAELFAQQLALGGRCLFRQTEHLNLVDVHAEEVEDVQIVEHTVVPLKVDALQVLRVHRHDTGVSVRLANLEDGFQLRLVVEHVGLLVAVVVDKLDVHCGHLVKLLQTG